MYANTIMPYQFRFKINDEVVFHADLNKERCVGLTRAGNRCNRQVCIGINLCYSHLESLKHLKIKESTIPNAGKGLFAIDRTKPANAVVFKVGDLIANYIGETLTAAQVRQRYGTHTAPYGMQVQTGVFEDCAISRGYCSLCNQAPRFADKNAKFRFNVKVQPHRVQLVAIKPIRNGAEILTHYGAGNYKFDEDYTTKYVKNQ